MEFVEGKRLTVHTFETVRAEGRPLYELLLDRLRIPGVRAATATFAASGFDAATKRATILLDGAPYHLPVTVEAVGTAAAIDAALDALAPITACCVVDVARVRILEPGRASGAPE